MRNIASGWQTRPLGELAKTTSGGTPSRKRKEYYDGEIPWVKSGELNDDYILKTEEHITQEGLTESSAKLFPAGTLLIALYGATVGKTGILRIEASTNQAVCGIFPGPDIDNNYLRYHLVYLRPELLSHRYGGAQPNINQQIIRNQEIQFPPLPEQKKIAHVLSTAQRAIEAEERIIQAAAELKNALMHKLFTKGLHNEPLKQTEIGPVPESWDVAKVKDHCVDCAFGPRFGSELYAADGNILTLRTTDMEDDGRIDYNTAPLARIDYAKFEKHYLKVGDVVVSRSGTCGIASVFEGHSLPVLPGAFLIRLRMRTSVQPMFLRHYINSPVGRPYVLQLAQGAIQKNISGTRLGELLIPLPSIREQEEICSAVGTIDRKLSNHRRKLAASQALFRTLLHELMTAKIRVHDLELPSGEGAA